MPLVLVVEDDADARALCVACLEVAGFDIAEAGSMRAAIEAVASRTPDLVVLDRHVEDGDTLALAKQWRAGRVMMKAPIVMLTGHTSRADVEATLAAGCDVFLAKPCPPETLLAHVQKLLVQAAPTAKMPKVKL